MEANGTNENVKIDVRFGDLIKEKVNLEKTKKKKWVFVINDHTTHTQLCKIAYKSLVYTPTSR